MIKMAVKKMTITIEDLKMEASLNDSKTAQKVWDALPIEGRVNTWGDEIYFSIPVDVGSENAKAVVSEGDLGYWPPGSAFYIFGKIIGDPKVFKKVSSGAKIIIEKSK